MTMDPTLDDQLGIFLDALQDETASEPLYELSNKIQKWIEARPVPSMTHKAYKSALAAVQSYVTALADEMASEEEAIDRTQDERKRHWEISEGEDKRR